MLTSDAAECTYRKLKDIKILPIVRQVDEIKTELMELFQKRRAESLNINSRLTPYAETILSQETEVVLRLHVRMSGLVGFQVQSVNNVNVVHLDCRS